MNTHNAVLCLHAQVQDLLMLIMCAGSLVVLLLAVMTRFVCSAAQGKLLWCAAADTARPALTKTASCDCFISQQ
jgi:hypothetical protein